MSIIGKDERLVTILSSMLKEKIITEDYLRLLTDQNKIVLEEFVEIIKIIS